jgi:uncharacterized protein YndB with AHSA1/START domain
LKTILLLADIDAPRESVLDSLTTITGLQRWWTTGAHGDACEGGQITFVFGGEFNPVMLVDQVDQVDRDGVSWSCVGGIDQWADNTFRFALDDHAGGTRVRFRQEYATELSDDDYAVYNYNWAYYLESLRLLCSTGLGTPYRVKAGTSAPELISIARATQRPDRLDEADSLARRASHYLVERIERHEQISVRTSTQLLGSRRRRKTTYFSQIAVERHKIGQHSRS